jgi:hypothetical protein
MEEDPIVISAERVFPSGAWAVSAVIDGIREHALYYGYTKREAIADFKAQYLPK